MSSEDQQRSNPQQDDEQGLTRRRVLQILGTAAAVTAVEPALRDRSALAAAPGAPAPVALGAHPFSLTAVRLLDGPFKDAQERNGKYLLSLEPDRMLHNFRVNAGLQPNT
jgi:hypothetical protein